MQVDPPSAGVESRLEDVAQRVQAAEATEERGDTAGNAPAHLRGDAARSSWLRGLDGGCVGRVSHRLPGPQRHRGVHSFPTRPFRSTAL